MTRIILLAVLFFTTAGYGFSQANFNTVQTRLVVEKNVQLVTDIYFKDTVGQYPIVLLRTPYPRKQYEFIARFFCQQDYIVVVQSVRGTGGSTGQMRPFINETTDGLAVLDLLAAKSWCNGSIGMFGSSYGSFCGLTLGASAHPALKAIVNINGWVEPSLISMPSGVNHLMMNIPWMLFNFTNGKLMPGRYNADSLFKTTPVNEMMKNYIGLTLDQMQSSVDGFNEDMAYTKFDVPVLHVTGMYDFTKEGTMNVYDSLRKYNKTQRIIIGPWVHDQVFSQSKKIGDWDLPTPGYDSLGNRVLKAAATWFKTYVKKEPPVNVPMALSALPVFGESFNLNASEFPTEKIQQQVFHLNRKEASGSLEKKKGVVPSAVSFISDPNDPVPTNGGANFHFFPSNIGIKNQLEIEKRKDVLTYTSDKINGQFWGLGKAKVRLYVSYNSKDCDFTAKLVAVDKEGNAWNIADGISRMSITKKIPTGHQDIDGNMIYEIEIDMGHITFRTPARWSLRLEIAGSNFPKYDRNPGNGELSVDATKFYAVKQTVHMGGAFSSVLMVDELD